MVKDFISDLETRSAAMDAALEAEETALVMAAEMETDSAGLVRTTPDAAIAPGMEVLAGSSRQRGLVIRCDNKKSAKKETGRYWVVETGSVRMSFSETELFPVNNNQSSPVTVGWTTELAQTETGPKLELNLLGMRLEEALDILRRQIDAAVLAGLREFSVVHGKGDGILQKGVQDYLRNDPAVSEYAFSRPELGGFGRTEVVLK